MVFIRVNEIFQVPFLLLLLLIAFIYAILCSQVDSLHSSHAILNECLFCSAFLNICWSSLLTVLSGCYVGFLSLFVWLLLSSYMMVGGMCSFQPYGTGICHYAFILSKKKRLYSPIPFKFVLECSINKSDGMLMIAACPNFICFVSLSLFKNNKKGSIEETMFAVCVCMFCFILIYGLICRFDLRECLIAWGDPAQLTGC